MAAQIARGLAHVGARVKHLLSSPELSLTAVSRAEQEAVPPSHATHPNLTLKVGEKVYQKLLVPKLLAKKTLLKGCFRHLDEHSH